jgi:biopolymer transport protein ExbB
MINRGIWTVVVAVLFTCGLWTGMAQETPPPPPPSPELDFASVLESGDELLKAEMDEAPPGDMKAFTVVTDNDISTLEVEDIYKNNSSYFKVTAIRAKGRDGGRFTVERTSGQNDPARTWHRASGLGPATITSRETLLSRFLSGGSIMYPIALLALGVIILSINSLWIYRRGKQCPDAFVQAIRPAVKKHDIESVESLAVREKGLLAAICRAMVIDFDISKEEDIRMRCETEAQRQIGFLRAPLRTLNFIAAVAPLLGLLGTVVGMIACFDSISGDPASAGKAQAMANGIKVALLTTAFGLTVAVPALLAYFVFNQRLSNIVADCENYMTEFVHKLSLSKRDVLEKANS